jgi:prepilin-type processing-associated H-X9-DG protein
MYKVLGNDGKEYGPVSADQLRQWIAQGRAVRDTKVQAEGSTDWKPLSAIPEFATAFAAPPISAASQPQFTEPAKTSGLAIASVICGALGLVTCITSPIGLILGIIAKNEIGKSEGRVKGSGLATTGIILSCVTFAIFGMAFLAGLLLPALAKARQKAQTVNCINNMKQLGLAARMYAEENHNKLPASKNWSDLLSPTVRNPKAFVCPTDPTHRSSYSFNAKLSEKNPNEVNPSTVLFFESTGDWNSSGGPEDMVTKRHGSYVVVCFADGSVRQIRSTNVDTLRWDP